MVMDDTKRADLLFQALQDALEGLNEMFPYVPEYFVQKWGLEQYIKRAEVALNKAAQP